MNRAEKRRQQKRAQKQGAQSGGGADRLWAQAVKSFQSGNLAVADQACAKILATQRAHGGALFLRGVIARQRGESPEKILAFLDKAAQAEPKNPTIHMERGTLLQALGQADAAIAAYEAVLTLQPAMSEAHNNLGTVYFTGGNLEQALIHHEKAVSLSPANTAARVNLANTLTACSDAAAAEKQFRAALRLDPSQADALNNLGNLLQKQGRVADAEGLYRQALAQRPEDASTLKNLGTAVLKLGRLADAAQYFEQALAVQPDYAEAFHQLAYFPGGLDLSDRLPGVTTALADPSTPASRKIPLAFGLGKVLEDQGRYAEAFEAFDQGNRLVRETLDYAIAEDRQRAAEVETVFDAAFMGAPPSFPPSDRDITPIFIVGMPRSGTSLVEQILASHPQCWGGGELNFLSKAVRQVFGPRPFPAAAADLSPQDWADLGAAYVAQLRAFADQTAVITDKMPDNWWFIGVIRAALPQARIVHCRRDPMAIGLSLYKHYFPAGGHAFAYDLTEIGQYIQVYHQMMDHWHRACPGLIHDLPYEDLIANQEAETRKLLAYCGLDWDDVCLTFHKTDRPVQTASAAQVRKPIYRGSLAQWERYADQLAPLAAALKTPSE
ncbi:MAG: sulfotransferase [Magnetospiraceae bacterium]